MSQIAEYGILRHQPYPNRSEHLNIGIVAFLPDGEVRLHLAANLRKLKAFDPQVDLNVLRSWEIGLPQFLQGVDPEQAKHALKYFGSLRLSDTLGRFVYHNEHEYTERVESTMVSLVEPRPRTTKEHAPKSRLYIDLRDTFKAHGWLGTNKEDITKHKIVTRFPVAVDEGVQAEFALRNGRLHILETMDFRTSTSSAKKHEAMSKALVFDIACEIEGNGISSYVVVAGGSQPEASGTVKLLGRYAEHVLHWEDKADIDMLMNAFANATGQPMLNFAARH